MSILARLLVGLDFALPYISLGPLFSGIQNIRRIIEQLANGQVRIEGY